MRYAILSLVMLMSMSSSLSAEPIRTGCPTAEIVSTVLKKHFRDVRLTRIQGHDAQRFVNAFNSGSASGWPADEVVIARNPNTPDRARIGFFKEGCLLALVPHNLWAVDSLQRSLKTEQDI
jgi:hypothetical protein